MAEFRKSRLSESKQLQLRSLFVAGATARTSAELVSVNPKTAAYYFHRLRQIIRRVNENHAPVSGEIEVDESYFGGTRKGKRGRGAASKVPVFGLLKRGGNVYARVIPDVRRRTLKPNQWDREFLESGQASYAPIQRYRKRAIFLCFSVNASGVLIILIRSCNYSI